MRSLALLLLAAPPSLAEWTHDAALSGSWRCDAAGAAETRALEGSAPTSSSRARQARMSELGVARRGALSFEDLQAFFAEHLGQHKRASPQTIHSYRDTFRLLLGFMKERTGTAPASLRLETLNADAVLAFLDHLESQRGCSVRSRSCRCICRSSGATARRHPAC